MTFACLNLGSLSGTAPLLSDSDGDGYPDQINIGIGLIRAMNSGPVWAGLINLAARLSMESCAREIALPAVCSSPTPGMLLIKNPCKVKEPAARLEKTGSCSWQLTGRDPLAMKQMLDSLALATIIPDTHSAICIDLDHAGADVCRAVLGDGTRLSLSLATTAPLASPTPPAAPCDLNLGSPLNLASLADTILIPVKDNPRARKLSLELVLPQTLSMGCGLALFGLVTAAASRATALALPMAGTTPPGNGGLCMNIRETMGQEALVRQGKDGLHLTGPPKDLALLLRELTRLWFEPDAPQGETLEAWKNRLNEAAAMASGQNRSGRILHSMARGESLSWVDSSLWHKAAAACRRLNLPEPARKKRDPGLTRQTRLPGEARAILESAEKLARGKGQVCCTAFVGGDHKTRLLFREQLDRILISRGYAPKTRVLRTHKPAVSWLLEEVEPQIPSNTQSLEISVLPFAAPSQMEPATRWIHELYPAPDILCRRRGWPLDRVKMVLLENQAENRAENRAGNRQEEAYQVRAFDQHNKELKRFSLTPMVSALPYALRGRDGRTAYPVAAGFELYSRGRRLHAITVPTDREVFWRRFQDRWLPEMEGAMIAMLEERLESGSLAFWEEIRIEVAIDDTQESLDFAQERIAPMEALHEDLYFGLLGFMETFRNTHCPDSRIQLGRIVPIMRQARGQRPWATIKLLPLQRPLVRHPSPPFPLQMASCQGRLFADFRLGKPGHAPFSQKETQRFCTAAKAWGLHFSAHGDGIRYSARPAPKTALPPSLPTSIPVPPGKLDLKTIPSGSEVRQWTNRLGNRPGLRVWQAGQTLMGRDILAVEATWGRMTAGRARLLKPTLLVNARHHANEVSGTNAAMDLLAFLATPPITSDPITSDPINSGPINSGPIDSELAASGPAVSDLLKQINVVVVPLENADGVATLEEMLPHAPDHKLHAARYNALGMEWYDQYFERETPFSEARVKARLFDRWLPAYIIDLHGVPSHEWEQPFAGYLPPGFEEHWIPRSFVYAIVPFYGDTDHPGGGEAATLAGKMSQNLENQRQILELNREVYDRYHRYAKAFDPGRFNAGMAGALVVVPTCQRISQTNFANRKWPLVQSEIITEVLDEVARGPWLASCAMAHRTVIQTLTEHMRTAAKPASLIRRQTSEGISFSWETGQGD